jgi:hypothetical protein
MSARIGWRAVLAGLSLMVIGAAAGIAIDRFVQHEHGALAAELEELHNDPMKVFDRTIDLRPDQRPRIHAILQAHQAATDSLWHSARLRLQATIDSVLLEIDTILDPEQSVRFHESVERLHGMPFPSRPSSPPVRPDSSGNASGT